MMIDQQPPPPLLSQYFLCTTKTLQMAVLLHCTAWVGWQEFSWWGREEQGNMEQGCEASRLLGIHIVCFFLTSDCRCACIILVLLWHLV